jgi:hypothetical protein
VASELTAFVRCLDQGQAPEPDLFREIWARLRGFLGAELKRRGLWRTPPCYLGVYGRSQWEEDGGSALDELVAECYAFIFVDRLRSLQAQLRLKPSLDGLILLDVRHFLYERQRAHDPLGFVVFELLQAAVREAVAAGDLHILAGDPRVRNDTLLGVAGLAEPAGPPPDLEPVVSGWNDELIPELVMANGRHTGAIARLRRRLSELPELGVAWFRFGDLVGPLKIDARLRWATLLEEEGLATAGDSPGRTPVSQEAPPDLPLELRESDEHLTRCVSASIHRLEADPRTRNHLSTLWRYARFRHVGAADEETRSYRQLSRRLQIPRDRLPELISILRGLVERCRAAGLARLR